MGSRVTSVVIDNAARGGQCIAMAPRTQRDPTRVDVGQREPNCGCPPGTTPVKLEAAYVGTLDGSFLKFDCARNATVVLPGRLKNTR